MIRRAFTLIELLVVISIMALLVTLLVPSLNRARQMTRTVTCYMQIRQIGQATHLYAEDNNDFFPPSIMTASSPLQTWEYLIIKEIGGNTAACQSDPVAFEFYYNGLYRCPSDTRRAPNMFSYGANDYFEVSSPDFIYEGAPATWHRTADVPHAQSTVFYGELKQGAMPDHFMPQDWRDNQASPGREVDSLRHQTGSNYAFVDGHEETRALSDLYQWNAGAPASTKDQFNPGKAR